MEHRECKSSPCQGPMLHHSILLSGECCRAREHAEGLGCPYLGGRGGVSSIPESQAESRAASGTPDQMGSRPR